MQKSTLLCMCLLAFVFASQAHGADGPYINLKGGIALLSDADGKDSANPGDRIKVHYDSGTALAAGVGYSLGSARAELELSYQKNDFDKLTLNGAQRPLNGDIKTTALLLNGYYDFRNHTPFTPFLSAGLGFARVDLSDRRLPATAVLPAFTARGGHDTVFAYQLGGGVGYAVTQNITVDLTYRYFATRDAQFTPTEKIENASHNIYLGIRFGF